MEFFIKFKTQLNVINNKITFILIHFENNKKKKQIKAEHIVI